jgi:3-hydroxyacyl-[acyl-carrier-protein] dehydratase
MFLNTLYAIERAASDGELLRAQILINPAHELFGGHFPDMPVLPGVCQIQILSEVIAYATGYRLALTKVSSAKFLSPVLPDQNTEITMEVTMNLQPDKLLSVTAVYTTADIVCMKFKGDYSIS